VHFTTEYPRQSIKVHDDDADARFQDLVSTRGFFPPSGVMA